METDQAVLVPWEVLFGSADKAMEEDNYVEAELMTLAALEEAEDFEPSDFRLHMTLERLAEIYYLQEKYSQGAPICKRLLKLFSRLMGEDHLDTAVIEHNLAMLYHSWGKFGLAEPLYKHALASEQKALGSQHPQVLTLLGHYTTLLYQTGRKLEAEKIRAEAVSVSRGRFTKSGRWEALVPDGKKS